MTTFVEATKAVMVASPLKETDKNAGNDTVPVEAPPKVEINPKRVYIRNIRKDVSEGVLKEFFKGRKVTDVLIPTKTVRGLNGKSKKPFGIAFADFETAEEAAMAIEELSGTKLNDKEVILKVAEPTTHPRKTRVGKLRRPHYRRNSKERNESKKSIDKSNDTDVKTDGPKENEGDVNKASSNPIDTKIATPPELNNSQQKRNNTTKGRRALSKIKQVVDPKLTEDTVFIQGFHPKMGTKDIEELLKPYDPLLIKILRPEIIKGKRHYFRPSKLCLLVQFEGKEQQAKVIKDLDKKKLENSTRPLLVRAAYDSKGFDPTEVIDVKTGIITKKEPKSTKKSVKESDKVGKEPSGVKTATMENKEEKKNTTDAKVQSNPLGKNEPAIAAEPKTEKPLETSQEPQAENPSQGAKL